MCFKSWVLHIPHCLRDLLWMMRDWSSVSPIFSSLLMSRASSSSRSLLKVISSFWHTFFKWMNAMILGGHSSWLSSLLLLLQQVVLWFERPLWSMTVWSMYSGSSHSSTGFLRSYFDLCSSYQIAWSRNQTSSVSLGKTLVVQGDPWLNQQWSSWPWPSSSCVRLWASSPSGTGTSLLM